MLSEMSEIERRFFKWYKEFDPSSAYTDGANECAGRFFVPSKQLLATAKKELEKILKIAQNEEQRSLFKSFLTSLRFNEPYMVPSRATSAFFSHLVKEGVVPEHLRSLAMCVDEALDAYTKLLADKKWSIEIRIDVSHYYF